MVALPELTRQQVDSALSHLVMDGRLRRSARGYYELGTRAFLNSAPERALEALELAADTAAKRAAISSLELKRQVLHRLALLHCPSIGDVLMEIRDDISRRS